MSSCALCGIREGILDGWSHAVDGLKHVWSRQWSEPVRGGFIDFDLSVRANFHPALASHDFGPCVTWTARPVGGSTEASGGTGSVLTAVGEFFRAEYSLGKHRIAVKFEEPVSMLARWANRNAQHWPLQIRRREEDQLSVPI